MKNLENNKYRILFSRGRLFLNDVQIAGIGITPEKDVLFEFAVKGEIVRNQVEIPQENPPVLKINVVDSVNSKDIGPGQKG